MDATATLDDAQRAALYATTDRSLRNAARLGGLFRRHALRPTHAADNTPRGPRLEGKRASALCLPRATPLPRFRRGRNAELSRMGRRVPLCRAQLLD